MCKTDFESLFFEIISDIFYDAGFSWEHEFLGIFLLNQELW